MNRTSFLFLALLIASCILTVNSRHAARTLISEKAVLTEKVHAMSESLRRLELENARVAAKNIQNAKATALAESPEGKAAQAKADKAAAAVAATPKQTTDA
jgi:cell division protein FtsL